LCLQTSECVAVYYATWVVRRRSLLNTAQQSRYITLTELISLTNDHRPRSRSYNLPLDDAGLRRWHILIRFFDLWIVTSWHRAGEQWQEMTAWLRRVQRPTTFIIAYFRHASIQTINSTGTNHRTENNQENIKNEERLILRQNNSSTENHAQKNIHKFETNMS